MKWFQHMCSRSARRQNRIILEALGYSGYGMWWVLIETLGESVLASNTSTNKTLSLREWSWRTGIHVMPLRKLFVGLEELGAIELDIVSAHRDGSKSTRDMFDVNVPQLNGWFDATVKKMMKK